MSTTTANGHDRPTAQEAALVWRDLTGRPTLADRYETLKEPHRKSAVFRLFPANAGGERIVAKECPTSTAQVERVVYQELLPLAGVPRLRCHALVASRREGRSWLFLEDAAGRPFNAGIHADRVIAARWMATLHRFTDEVALSAVPHRGAQHLLGVVQAALQAMEHATVNPDLDSRSRRVAQSAVALCMAYANRWDDIVAICDDLPKTLVHGGFGRKNVAVRSGPDGAGLKVFDWEAAGNGPPIVDLARVDIETYGDSIGPDASASTRSLRRAQRLGRAIWCISSIPGEALSLSSPWAGRVMPKIEAYVSELEDSLASLGWEASHGSMS